MDGVAHDSLTSSAGRDDRLMMGANVAIATTRISHLTNDKKLSATAVLDSNISSNKILCYGDLITLSIDGIGFLAPRESISCKQQDDGNVTLVHASYDGNIVPVDFQTRCVWRVESGGNGVGATEFGQCVTYGSAGGIVLRHVQSGALLLPTSRSCFEATESLFAVDLYHTAALRSADGNHGGEPDGDNNHSSDHADGDTTSRVLRAAQLFLQPRYRFRAEGEVVYFNDCVVLQSGLHRSQRISVRKPDTVCCSSQATRSGAINSTTHAHILSLGGWRLSLFHRTSATYTGGEDRALRAGSFVRLLHREAELNLCCRRLRAFPDSSRFPIASTNACPRESSSDALVTGSAVHDGSTMCSPVGSAGAQLFTISVGGNDTAVSGPMARVGDTIWQLQHTELFDGRAVNYSSLCRIMNVATGSFLCASSDGEIIVHEGMLRVKASSAQRTSIDTSDWDARFVVLKKSGKLQVFDEASRHCAVESIHVSQVDDIENHKGKNEHRFDVQCVGESDVVLSFSATSAEEKAGWISRLQHQGSAVVNWSMHMTHNRSQEGTMFQLEAVRPGDANNGINTTVAHAGSHARLRHHLSGMYLKLSDQQDWRLSSVLLHGNRHSQAKASASDEHEQKDMHEDEEKKDQTDLMQMETNDPNHDDSTRHWHVNDEILPYWKLQAQFPDEDVLVLHVVSQQNVQTLLFACTLRQQLSLLLQSYFAQGKGMPSIETLGELQDNLCYAILYVSDQPTHAPAHVKETRSEEWAAFTERVLESDDAPLPERQTQLFEQGIIELLIELAEACSRIKADDGVARETDNSGTLGTLSTALNMLERSAELCYRLLGCIMASNARTVTHFIERKGIDKALELLREPGCPQLLNVVFQSYQSFQSFNAVSILEKAKIKRLVDELEHSMLKGNGCDLLHFLASICTPGDVPDSIVQHLVLDMVVGNGNNCSMLYRTRVLEDRVEIDLSHLDTDRLAITAGEHDIKHLSTDDSSSAQWKPLATFLFSGSGAGDADTYERIKYYEMQLHLLIALSKGRHAKCHTAISKIVSAEHILLMLESANEGTNFQDFQQMNRANTANIASLYCTLMQVLYCESSAISAAPRTVLNTNLEWDTEEYKKALLSHSSTQLDYHNGVSKTEEQFQEDDKIMSWASQYREPGDPETPNLQRKRLRKYLLAQLRQADIDPDGDMGKLQLTIAQLKLLGTLLRRRFFLGSASGGNGRSSLAAVGASHVLVSKDLEKIMFDILKKTDPARRKSLPQFGIKHKTESDAFWSNTFGRTDRMAGMAATARIELLHNLGTLLDMRLAYRLDGLWDTFRDVYRKAVEDKLSNNIKRYEGLRVKDEAGVVTNDEVYAKAKVSDFAIVRNQFREQCKHELDSWFKKSDLYDWEDDGEEDGGLAPREVMESLRNLMLFEGNPTLTAEAVRLIHRQYTQRDETIATFGRVSMILDKRDYITKHEIKQMVGRLSTITANGVERLNDKSVKTVCEIFRHSRVSKTSDATVGVSSDFDMGLTELCYRTLLTSRKVPLRSEFDHPDYGCNGVKGREIKLARTVRVSDLDELNQELLRSHGADDAALAFLRALPVDITHADAEEKFGPLRLRAFERAFEFLYYFCLDNDMNRKELSPRPVIHQLLGHMHFSPTVPVLLAEVLKDNSKANRAVAEAHVQNMVQQLKRVNDTDRWPTEYLLLLKQVVEDEHGPLYGRQRTVILNLRTHLSDILGDLCKVHKLQDADGVYVYNHEQVHKLYAEMAKAQGTGGVARTVVDLGLDSELAFHLHFLDLLGMCAKGRNKQTEQFCGALFPIRSLLNGLAAHANACSLPIEDTTIKKSVRAAMVAALKEPLVRIMHGVYFSRAEKKRGSGDPSDVKSESGSRHGLRSQFTVVSKSGFWTTHARDFVPVFKGFCEDLQHAFKLMRWAEDDENEMRSSTADVFDTKLTDEDAEATETFEHYVSEVLLPFLSDFFRGDWAIMVGDMEKACIGIFNALYDIGELRIVREKGLLRNTVFNVLRLIAANRVDVGDRQQQRNLIGHVESEKVRKLISRYDSNSDQVSTSATVYEHSASVDSQEGQSFGHDVDDKVRAYQLQKIFVTDMAFPVFTDAYKTVLAREESAQSKTLLHAARDEWWHLDDVAAQGKISKQDAKAVAQLPVATQRQLLEGNAPRPMLARCTAMLHTLIDGFVGHCEDSAGAAAAWARGDTFKLSDQGIDHRSLRTRSMQETYRAGDTYRDVNLRGGGDTYREGVSDRPLLGTSVEMGAVVEHDDIVEIDASADGVGDYLDKIDMRAAQSDAERLSVANPIVDVPNPMHSRHVNSRQQQAQSRSGRSTQSAFSSLRNRTASGAPFRSRLLGDATKINSDFGRTVAAIQFDAWGPRQEFARWTQSGGLYVKKLMQHLRDYVPNSGDRYMECDSFFLRVLKYILASVSQKYSPDRSLTTEELEHGEREARRLHALQSHFIKLGAPDAVLSIVSRAPEQHVAGGQAADMKRQYYQAIVPEALELGVALLEGGHRGVQEHIQALCEMPSRDHSSSQSNFFLATRALLKRCSSVMHASSSTGTAGRSTLQDITACAAMKQHAALATLILRFLQLLCEGHNSTMQSLLREQRSMSHSLGAAGARGSSTGDQSINLVQEVVMFFNALCAELVGEIHYVHDKTFLGVAPQMARTNKRRHVIDWLKPPSTLFGTRLKLASQCCEALTEFCQGPHPANQLILVRGGGCDAVRRLLDFAGVMQLNTPIDPIHGILRSYCQESGALRFDTSTRRGPGLSTGTTSQDLTWRGYHNIETLKLRAAIQPDWENSPACKEAESLVRKADKSDRDNTREEKQRQDLLRATRAMEQGLLHMLVSLLEGGPSSCQGKLTSTVLRSIEIEVLADNLEIHWRERTLRMRSDPANRSRARRLLQMAKRPTGQLETTPFLYYSLILALRDVASTKDGRKLYGAARFARKFQRIQSAPALDGDVPGRKMWAHLQRMVASVEVVGTGGQVGDVYFPVPAMVLRFWHTSSLQMRRQQLLVDVKRDTVEEKVKDFMDRGDELVFVLQQREAIEQTARWSGRAGGIMLAILTRSWFWRRLTLMLSLTLNIVLIATMTTDSAGKNTPLSDADIIYRGEGESLERQLSLVQAVFVCVFALAEYVTSVTPAVELALKRNRDRSEAAGVTGGGYAITHASVARGIRRLRAWAAFFTCTSFAEATAEPLALPRLLWWIWYTLINERFAVVAIQLIAAFSGLLISPAFYALCLVDIIPQSRTMRSVVAAVTRNWPKFLTTGVLALFLLYLYATVAFNTDSYRGAFEFEERGDCSSLSSCLSTFVTYGLLHPPIVSDTDPQTPETDEGTGPLITLPFTLSYNIFVNLVLTAMLSGIIIDAFSEMRAHAEDVRKDQQEKCFVCGIDRDVFEQHGLSFERHARDDHYMWNYIFLKIYLEQKDPTEYTGQEHHIRQLMKEQRWAAFFPIKKALAIQDIATTEKNDMRAVIRRIDALQQTVARLELNLKQQAQQQYRQMADVSSTDNSTATAGMGTSI